MPSAFAALSEMPLFTPSVLPRRLTLAASLIVASTASLAVPITYTTLSSFDAATSSNATDSFNDVSITASTAAPLARSVGTYQYSIQTSDNDSLFGAGSDPDHWLSVNTAGTSLVFTDFSMGVRAIGGLFFGSDAFGGFAAGSVLLTATDGTGSTTLTIDEASPSSFMGFVSSGPMTSLTITAIQPADSFLWTTVNDLVLATVAPVPEPATAPLMFGGLGVIGVAGWLARRRTNPFRV